MCKVHGTIVRIFLVICACGGGRHRADFQKFARKIARSSTAKSQNFGAERARNVQSTRAEPFQEIHETSHTTLRSCRSIWSRCARVLRKNCAGIHRNFRDFHQKSRVSTAEFAAKITVEIRQSASSCAACILRLYASLVCFARAVVADIVPIFKNLRAKSREFRSQNRTISVPTVRATFNLRAQNQPESFRRHSTPPCALRQGPAAAARVFCAKTAPKFIETFAISTENHEFRPPN